MARFDSCLQFTWRPENDGQQLHVTAGDRGGATSWGVTLATYASWRAAHGHSSTTVADLAASTKTELAELYRERFWNTVSGDSLPAGVDLLVFDFGVTSGGGNSARLLQQVLGVVVDGNLGPKTLAAATARDRVTLIRQLHSRHAAYYQSLADFPRFGRGWTRRNDDRLTAALTSAACPAVSSAVLTPPSFMQEVRHALSV